jgi:hypothetical protein
MIAFQDSCYDEAGKLLEMTYIFVDSARQFFSLPQSFNEAGF